MDGHTHDHLQFDGGSDPDYGLAGTCSCAELPLTSEPGLFAGAPLTSEPPLAADDNLISEPMPPTHYVGSPRV
ncbi:hypothetical protein SRB5_52720 [Streptomyces sp. RB5]|uniref:Uncharacterized protein n=1 Tax=Streptomyces smaragdinus TaxID=2585196 RepID=A0A7K0CQR5_9ACTN|nr:hypothetical protein [Streptomyces smaragdinus]MQY15094.1 hypothetical protein [Streptomyces smaragdinus]